MTATVKRGRMQRIFRDLCVLPVITNLQLGAGEVRLGGDSWHYEGDPECWTPDITRRQCCNEKYGDAGTPSCWVEGFRFTKCCGVRRKEPYSPPARRSIDITHHCDFIVVGAGSGGATVASRLETAFRVCIVDVTNDPENKWTSTYHVGEFNYAFGQGIGGSTLISSGVYTRGELKDYEEWGGEKYWNINRTLGLFRSIEVIGTQLLC